MNETFARESRKAARRKHTTATYVLLAKVTLYGLRPDSHGVEATPSIYRATQFTDALVLSVTLP